MNGNHPGAGPRENRAARGLTPRRWIIAAAALLLACLPASPPASAQEAAGLAAWLSPEMGRLNTRLAYSHHYATPAKIEGGGPELGWRGHHLSLLTPVLQNERQELAVSARLNLLELDATPLLPDSRLRLPERLWDPRLGGSYRRKLESGLIAGLSAEIGSPSDKPFQSGDELSVNATAFLRLPQAGDDAWLFLVNYDHNREFLRGAPLPGVAYWLAPSPAFQALLGIPFFNLRWLPAADWEVSAAYLMPYRLRAAITHRLGKRVNTYLGFDWGSQRWLLADRPQREDRLFFWQKRLTLGLRFPLASGLEADLGLGWAFDRMIFQGENWDDRDQDRLSLEDGPFLSAQVGWRF